MRIYTNSDYGMVEINGLQGEIVAIGQADANSFTNTITVNINSSGFTAFAFPTTGDVPFTPAIVVPIGEGTNSAIANPNLLDDATVNTAYIGVILGAAATLPSSGTSQGPAGSNGDVIYWQAGTVFSTAP